MIRFCELTDLPSGAELRLLPDDVELLLAGGGEQPVVAGQHEHQLVRVAVLQGEHNVLGRKRSTVIYDANQSV